MSDRELSAFNNTRISTSGNLAADPSDISRAEDGGVAVFNLVVNRRDNNGDEYTDFFNCKSISRSMSQNILGSIRKGMAVEVEGRLEISYWEDRRDGTERAQFGILLDRVHLPLKYRSLQDHIDKFEEEDDGDEPRGRRKSKARGRRQEEEDDEEDDDDEDEDETPRRGRGSRSSSRRSSGRSSRRSSRKDDDDEDDSVNKTRRSRRSTRTRGDSEDDDDDI